MRSQRLRHSDYEQLGYETMRETKSEQLAKQICALRLQALRDELHPQEKRCEDQMAEKRLRGQALCDQIYRRPMPVSDRAMVGMSIGLLLLVVLFGLTFVSSAVSHTITFAMFGWSLTVSAIVGMTVTVLAAAVGYQVFETMLLRNRLFHGLIAAASFALCFWGLVQLAQARGAMTSIVPQTRQPQSFVDGSSVSETMAELDDSDRESLQENVRELLGDAVIKMMLAADIIVGVFFGLVATIRSDPDFASWREIRTLKRQVARLQVRFNNLRSIPDSAAKKCAAGILRGRHFEGCRSTPYFRMLPVILVVLFGMASVARAQTSIRHHEVVLVDVSGSISKKTQTSSLFREYLLGVRRLLETEPPNSRIWVQLISTDSFGGVQTLVKGWTPSVQGIFTDDLDRARRQLVAAFESKATDLRPIAAGTDITGGLWRAKAAIESKSRLDDSARSDVTKDVYILSDMMNETAAFNMPALLPSGPQRVLEYAKANGLLVPLSGYRIHVFGASTAGMSPDMWNTVKSFWMVYFRAAGAELITYSSEDGIGRN